jgi:3-oxoadipate enol-lactonase
VSDAPWRVDLTRTAQRDLRRLDPPIRKRVETALRTLAEDPQRPSALPQAHGCARGMIAEELALDFPDRVRRLVLGCTHAGVAHAARQPREAGRAFALQTDDWAQRIRTLAPFAFARDVDPALLDAFIAKKSHDVQDPAGYAGQIAAVLGHYTYDRLPRIACPTLVITGDDDQVIPAPSSDVLHDRIPGSRLEVLASTGHLFFLEAPGETERVLRDFLD